LEEERDINIGLALVLVCCEVKNKDIVGTSAADL